MRAAQLFQAPGLDPLVAIRDDGTLLSTLDAILTGWRMTPVPWDGASEPMLRVTREGDSWVCAGETYDTPLRFTDPVSTACSVMASLFKAHTLVNQDALCLHAAGVRIGRGVVLLTGHYRAGKTVVAAACAAAGMQVFSDDIIPLDPDGLTARAPGLAIRLRLPLPESLTPETRAFIEANRSVASERYAYVRPPDSRLAPHGLAAPIAGVVTLRRGEGSPLRLRRLGPGDALSETIRRNFAREVPAGRILDTFEALLARVPCLSLDYDIAEDAAAILQQAFEGDMPPIESEPVSVGLPLARRKTAPPLPDTLVLSRSPTVRAREHGGHAFLTDAEEFSIFTLNPTGAGVWRMLSEPTHFGDLVEVFAAAFPETDAGDLRADLSALVRDLEAAGMVETALPAASQRTPGSLVTGPD